MVRYVKCYLVISKDFILEGDNMKTPKQYTINLKNNIITKEMLVDCLFSVNKRAKNYRDQERLYREQHIDIYDTESKCRQKKEEYYSKKERLLTLLEPTCIHKETIFKRRKVKIYDWDECYDQLLTQNKFIYKSEYYDRELEREVCFGVRYEEEIIEKYYLFYDCGEVSFHSPIREDMLKKYDLEIIDLEGELHTIGKEISELVSVQFVNKVLEVIEGENYVFKEK